MSVAAIGGIVGIAPQAAGKVGDGVFDASALTWRRYRSPQVDLGAVEMTSPFPQEMSGFYTPTGVYKGGAYFGGSIDMLPRMQSVMGFFLYALMGSVSSVSGKDMDANNVTGLYTHIFRYNATNSIPWFATRLKIPNETPSDELSIYGYDCKVNVFQFRMNAASKLTCRIGILGRVPFVEENPTYVWQNNLEDDQTVPEACTGLVSINGLQPAVMSMQLDIVNTLTSPAQEMVFGKRHPDDFTSLARGIIIRVQTKWNNPDLLQKCLTNLANGSAWSPTPYIEENLGIGENNGFVLRADAPGAVSGSSPSTNHGFAVRGNRVVWTKDGNQQMAAGGMVTQGFIGTIVTPSNNSQDYCQVIMQNGTNGYLWS